jgi:aprataxin
MKRKSHYYEQFDNKNMLNQYIINPGNHDDDILLVTEDVVIIFDKYPKAKFHLLIIPKTEFWDINQIAEARPKDTEKLLKMHKLGKKVFSIIVNKLSMITCNNDLKLKSNKELFAKEFIDSFDSKNLTAAVDDFASDLSPTQLKLGYHSVPSLHPLHLHLMSNDLESPCLKTKRHWNSFTTSFFIDSSKVENDLLSGHHSIASKTDTGTGTDTGIAAWLTSMEDLLKEDMRCPHCGVILKNIPTVKQHQQTCNKGILTKEKK